MREFLAACVGNRDSEELQGTRIASRHWWNACESTRRALDRLSHAVNDSAIAEKLPDIHGTNPTRHRLLRVHLPYGPGYAEVPQNRAVFMTPAHLTIIPALCSVDAITDQGG